MLKTFNQAQNQKLNSSTNTKYPCIRKHFAILTKLTVICQYYINKLCVSRTDKKPSHTYLKQKSTIKTSAWLLLDKGQHVSWGC